MYHFIVNPNSRTGHGRIIWNTVERELQNRNIPYEVTLTQCVGHARQTAHALSLKKEPVTIVLIGGDGTVNEVLSGLVLSDYIQLGYIPTGSGNDFARGMGIPENPIQALELVLTAPHYTLMDVGIVENKGRTSRFGVSCGMGFDASICHEALTSPLKKVLNRIHLGKLTYFFIALKQLLLYTPQTMTIEMDGGRTITYDKAYFVSGFNQRSEGGGLHLCPKAWPDDQILDIFVAESMKKPVIALLLPCAFSGLHTHIKGVHILHCKRIHIHCDNPLPIHRDGESGGNHTDICLSIENNSLKVITPVL